MDGTLLLAGGAAMLSALGALESYYHNRLLRRIPYRIHVNGTRGKSSVTRLIAAGLRAGGISTCAKTTGTLPRMIFPDGSEYPVYRPSRSNIIEQVRVIRAAAAANAEALVIECMALNPQLQSVCELSIVKSTHGVLTNARADHLEVMGPTEQDVARAMAGTMPVNGKFFTAEQDHLGIFAEAAKDRGSSVNAVTVDDVANISWDDLSGFAHIEHPDNVALALKVCQDLGVPRRVALAGMWSAAPDAGVLQMYSIRETEKELAFVNGFAANDPESTGQNWNMVVGRFKSFDQRIALFNCRADRSERSVQLADACLKWQPADRYVLIGSGTEVFAKRALANGMHPSQLLNAERLPTENVVNNIRQHSGRAAMIMGMGNIYGPGMQMIDYFNQRGTRYLSTLPNRDTTDGTASPTLEYAGAV
ncbi:poly-gamma-glutamate synthase PgsB [Aeoliella mucimassa]|uniref:Capsule biosynthesis protein CapB n=1 Tax=Aeoliella mucimassa TaxID=2527972 RepID=A0A518AJT9_9BACT|nr:poly-gamma-glutamate synthase PgsB [Aeoliella mucimassa]QDU54998.1 Capsule biosynthesis protein CapB [Aeoliella mucimassa]